MTNTPIEALSAINVGVINDEGSLAAVITLEEFVRVAKKSAHLHAYQRNTEKSAVISTRRTMMISLPK